MLDTSTRIAVVVFLLAVPATLQAEQQESFSSRIEGTWEAPVSEAEARETIDEAIEAVVGQMIFFKRPFARSELREATEPCSTIRIGFGDDKVTIRCDDRKPTTTRTDGTSTEWTSYDDETYTLSQKVESNQIVQTFESDKGTRTNTYSLKDEETLLLEVELEGEQLPEPLTYERTFERDD